MLLAIVGTFTAWSPALPGATPATSYKIVVIKSGENAFYDAAVHGFREGWKSSGATLDWSHAVKVVALRGESDADARTVRDLMRMPPDLFVAIGTDATRALADEKCTLPVIFSMVLDPVRLGVTRSLETPGGCFTGTTLLVSPGKQLDALLQADPRVRDVAVLYTDDDATSIAFLEDARGDAKRLSIEIVSVPVKRGETTAEALRQLPSSIDSLWLIPDPASTGPDAFAATLEYARTHKVPLLGASSATVRAGALLALSASLEDEGLSAAEMAIDVLNGGRSTASMRVRGPRRTLLTVNLDAARSLGITIPSGLLHLADEVIDSRKEPN